MAQKRLAGKALCSDQSCITSASMRNITRPRNTSMETTRVDPDVRTDSCPGDRDGERDTRFPGLLSAAATSPAGCRRWRLEIHGPSRDEDIPDARIIEQVAVSDDQIRQPAL